MTFWFRRTWTGNFAFATINDAKEMKFRNFLTTPNNVSESQRIMRHHGPIHNSYNTKLKVTKPNLILSAIVAWNIYWKGRRGFFSPPTISQWSFWLWRSVHQQQFSSSKCEGGFDNVKEGQSLDHFLSYSYIFLISSSLGKPDCHFPVDRKIVSFHAKSTSP